MSEKLCIFCRHFSWKKEEMWGMGSTQTGPMFEGGNVSCAKEHDEWPHWSPENEAEYRANILMAAQCEDYEAAQ